ncbi:MAG: peroxiredoxin [Paracoccaceae bacterium]|jgi:peroxiredoxin
MIKVGEKLPNAELGSMTDGGPVVVFLAQKLVGRKVAIFGFPGAFTPTCSGAHMPTVVRTKMEYDAKGVDEIICLAVNDVHVMRAWGESTGATKAGITLLADMDGTYTKAIGMSFDAPTVGFLGRSQRYSMYVEDGVVRYFNVEESRSTCTLSGGDNLLSQI